MPFFKLIFTPTEAATLLSCSTTSIYNFIHCGFLDAYRAPGHKAMHIRLCDLQKFVETKWPSTLERVQPSKRICKFPQMFNVA